MKFILTNFVTEKEELVTRECVNRIKGEIFINSLVKRVKETGEPIEMFFEGNYDLKITV